MTPLSITYYTCLTGLLAALSFFLGYLILGACLYAVSFILDSLDGKLNRVLGKDDTYRGTIDFILDGIVCFALVISLSWYNWGLTVLLLIWMGLHYLTMRYTSITYRLKVQKGDQSIWMVNETNTGWLLTTYRKFVQRFKTYPHPSTGEAVVAMFVIGPIVWALTGQVRWEAWSVIIGTVFMLPETIGAVILAYKLAKELRTDV